MAFTRSLQLKWTVDRKENTRFPLLGALSRRRLCIQGAAVPSERLFKKARDTCTKKRASMSPEYASDLIFCAENLPRMRDAQREKLKEEAVDKVELSLSSSSTKQASSSSTKQVCASSSSTQQAFASSSSPKHACSSSSSPKQVSSSSSSSSCRDGVDAADAFTALRRGAVNVALSIKATASRKRRCIQFNGDDGDIIDINVDDPADNGMFSYSL